MASAIQMQPMPPAGPAAAAGLISLQDLGKSYRLGDGRTLSAISNINVEIANGEFITVVGPSGCGKSTLLQILAGLMPATSGRAMLGGAPIVGPRRDVGIVFQAPVLLPWLRVFENVMLPAVVHRLDKEVYGRRAQELLKTVGLAGFERHFPRELSGGMEQRAALARALLVDPAMLLMDEPFGALDAMTREEMNLELLHVWSATRKTVVLITHSIAEAVFLADRVLVMSSRPGRLIADLAVDLPRPRTTRMYGRPEFAQATQRIRELLHLPERLD